MAAAIELKDVAIKKGSGYLYGGINWNVGQGEFWGFIGSNGTGKTAMLRAIMGLEPEFEGEVLLFGIPVQKFRDWRKIGYVPQRSFMFERNFPASVREIIESGLEPGFSRKEIQERVNEASGQMAIADLLEKRVGVLSGGQMQRVMVARALVKRPEVLIMDEPTAGVDFVSEHALYALLEKLNRKGTTIIIVSHDVGAITKKAKKLACLADRKLSLSCGCTDGKKGAHFSEHEGGLAAVMHAH